MGSTTIRPATADDAGACGRIMHDAFAGVAAAHGFPRTSPPPPPGRS
jgi:hypothetical protein